MRRRISRLVATLGALALILVSCSAGEPSQSTTTLPESDTTTTAPETTEPSASEERLIVAIGQDIPSLDARLPGGSSASLSVVRHMTEPLVKFDATTPDLIPVLAESWEQVDATTWRFKLREGVTFHNGNPLNADAVVYSVNSATAEGFTSWFSWASDGVLGEATKVDEYTVDISTVIETPGFPRVLVAVDVLDPDHVEAGLQATEPIGTGPYEFVEFTPRSELVLDRFDDYWGGTPSYSGITFRIIPEQATRVDALLSGEVHAINSISVEDIARIEAAENTKIASSPTTRHIMIALRHDRPPLDDQKIRQAMNYAVDKELITTTILTGIAVPTDGFLAPSMPYAQNDLGPWPYDPEKARDLLEEAGYAGEPITIAIGAGRYPSDDLVGQAVVKMLQDAGFNINLEAIDYSTMQAELGNYGDAVYDGWLQGWGATFLDSVGQMQGFFAGPNVSELPVFYDNAEYFAAVEEYKAASTEDEREVAVNKMENILWDEAAGLFLIFPVDNLGLASNLNGFEARFDEFFYFTETSLG